MAPRLRRQVLASLLSSSALRVAGGLVSLPKTVMQCRGFRRLVDTAVRFRSYQRETRLKAPFSRVQPLNALLKHRLSHFQLRDTALSVDTERAPTH